MHKRSCSLRPARAGVILFALAVALVASAQAQSLTAWQPDIVFPVPAYPFTFVGYGDIRFTSPGDNLDSNPRMRQAEIIRIAQEEPTFVLVSGDLVLRGDNAQDWEVFDAETASLRRAGIELFPALGNHDVWGEEKQALANYFQRFPRLGNRRWYSVRVGNMLVFVLDSTSDDAPGSEQWRWLEQGLNSLPADIDFVLVTLHHPPITHSSERTSGGGHSARPQEQQLGLLLEKYQQRLRARIIVLAGHVHNYERYERGGVNFIVSGGGGATPYTVQRASGDFYREAGPTYHICNFTVDRSELRFQMLKLRLDANQPRWKVGDSFVLRAGKARRSAAVR
jgi:predicted MPP superfamily phosphohydrolase